METAATVRLTMRDHPRAVTSGEFWINYWRLSSGGPDDRRGTARGERGVIDLFGSRLGERLSSEWDWKVEVHVRGVRYGTIELLLGIIGGEELLSEMFWTALEFYAPEAFNSAAGGSVPRGAQSNFRVSQIATDCINLWRCDPHLVFVVDD